MQNDERRTTNDERPALLISVAEAARRVGLGRTKVYGLIDAGKFPHKRIGRALRVPVKALEAWAESQEGV
jgi:excisionase family DNA binding protein